MPLVEQELLSLPEHLSSPLVFSGIRVAQNFSFLYNILYILVCPFVLFLLAIVLSVLLLAIVLSVLLLAIVFLCFFKLWLWLLLWYLQTFLDTDIIWLGLSELSMVFDVSDTDIIWLGLSELSRVFDVSDTDIWLGLSELSRVFDVSDTDVIWLGLSELSRVFDVSEWKQGVLRAKRPSRNWWFCRTVLLSRLNLRCFFSLTKILFKGRYISSVRETTFSKLSIVDTCFKIS